MKISLIQKVSLTCEKYRSQTNLTNDIKTKMRAEGGIIKLHQSCNRGKILAYGLNKNVLLE
jgi:hypothetical protein